MVIAVAVMITIMFVVPVAMLVPLMSAAIPPSVIFVPAAFPLCIQVAASIVSLPATLAVLANRVVQPVLGFVDPVFALFAVIRVSSRCRCGK